MGPFGHQWFSFGDRAPEAILAGTKAAANILDAFLDEALATRGLSDRDLALVGFSQGTMMALYVALRRPQSVAAVVGYSGALVGAETLAAEIRAPRRCCWSMAMPIPWSRFPSSPALRRR